MAGRVGVGVLMKFFGRKDGQTLADFAAETKALSDENYDAIHDGIANGSLTY